MNNNIYNIIYSKLVTWLTPSVLRKPKILAWLGIIIAPVQYIYQDLLRFRTAKLYELGITPQVCYLQKLLNDKYDYAQRRIKIVDAIDGAIWWIFTDAENKPQPIYTDAENESQYIFTDGECGGLLNDFIVEVPSAVTFNLNEMVSLLTNYKLASKQFAIQII